MQLKESQDAVQGRSDEAGRDCAERTKQPHTSVEEETEAKVDV